MAGIFINYRRDDAPGVAGRLFDYLATRFSKDDLFMDVDAMKPGIDFSKQLDTQVAQCRVLLAVIGPHWLDAKDKAGARRLDSDKDYVRIARKSQEIDLPLTAPRGTILDRSGQPLAMSVPTEKVTVNPLKVPDLQVASDLLALILHVNRTDLYSRMMDAHENGRGYLVVKSKITFEEGKNLRALHLDWVDIERRSERHYPGGPLAAHVLRAPEVRLGI